MKLNFKNIKENTKRNKKKHTLVLILVISSIFWFLTKLSKEYVSTVVYNVEYVNLPSAKLFQNNPEATIELRLKATGFRLLNDNLNRKTITIDLQDVNFKEKHYYYVLSRLKRNQVQKQLGNKVQLNFFEKDTLFFELGVSKFKKVPVVSNLDINYKLGYSLSKDIKITPDSIEIRGPEIQVDQIQELHMERLLLEEVSGNISQEVAVQLPVGLNKVTYEHTKATIELEVEKFTEGTFELNFQVTGLPENAKITTYPRKVKVVFKVGLSNYSKITPNSFQLECDYEAARKNNLDYLELKLVKKPEMVSSVKIIPNHIEYLIKR